MSTQFDLADLKRRMQGAVAALKHELGGLRTGSIFNKLFSNFIIYISI